MLHIMCRIDYIFIQWHDYLSEDFLPVDHERELPTHGDDIATRDKIVSFPPDLFLKFKVGKRVFQALEVDQGDQEVLTFILHLVLIFTNIIAAERVLL